MIHFEHMDLYSKYDYHYTPICNIWGAWLASQSGCSFICAGTHMAARAPRARFGSLNSASSKLARTSNERCILTRVPCSVRNYHFYKISKATTQLTSTLRRVARRVCALLRPVKYPIFLRDRVGHSTLGVANGLQRP